MNLRIADLRKEHNISQKNLAELLGVAQNTLSYWERGMYEPDLVSLKKIADFFEVSVDYLLGTTEDLYDYDKDPEDLLSRDVPLDLLHEWQRQGLTHKEMLHRARAYHQACDEDQNFLTGQTFSPALNTDKRLISILKNYEQLNEDGKEDLAKHAHHLTYIPEYKKDSAFEEQNSKIG